MKTMDRRIGADMGGGGGLGVVVDPTICVKGKGGGIAIKAE